MSVRHVEVNGQAYPVAPQHPEYHDHPSPAYPLTITPEVAKTWLTYNYRNRAKRARGLGNYGADMAAGNFALNGDTIRFSRPLGKGEDPDVPEGRVLLLDGQHRLQSCVDHNEPFVTYVVYGLDPEVRRTIDTGISRKFSDHLTMSNEKNANVLASVTARALAWEMGDRHLSLKKEGLTNSAMEEFLAGHPELRRSTEIAVMVHAEFIGAKIRQSVVGTAHWLFNQADPEQAPWFFARLGDGDELSKHHPIAALRKRILQDKQDQDARGRRAARIPDWQILCYMIRAWNAYLNDIPADQTVLLGRTDGDVMPTIRTAEDVADDVRRNLVRLEKPKKAARKAS